MNLDPLILNTGLELAMEFGEYWLRPIQERLHALHPHLNPAELDQYNDHCRGAMKFGHAEVPKCLPDLNADTKEAFVLFSKHVRARYPWVSEANLPQLFSQGCYYAMR